MELLWLLEFGVHKHSDSGKSIQIPEAGWSSTSLRSCEEEFGISSEEKKVDGGNIRH
jgi:hypothetical protein